MNKLNATIPTLSPSDANWVRKEVDEQWAAGNYVRAIEAKRSIEYAKREAKGFITAQVRLLDRISKNKKIARNLEILLFTQLATNFGLREEHSHVKRLVDEKIISVKDASYFWDVSLDEKQFQSYERICVKQSSYVFAGVVIPLLKLNLINQSHFQ